MKSLNVEELLKNMTGATLKNLIEFLSGSSKIVDNSEMKVFFNEIVGCIEAYINELDLEDDEREGEVYLEGEKFIPVVNFRKATITYSFKNDSFVIKKGSVLSVPKESATPYAQKTLITCKMTKTITEEGVLLEDLNVPTLHKVAALVSGTRISLKRTPLTILEKFIENHKED